MWGQGGRFYWADKEGEVGIVVVFAWLSSEERHLKPYVRLYSSYGWRSLICHADFLTLFFPDKAASLADSLLNELLQELKSRPLPIVFSAFSGGPKGCMYKVLQLIDGQCKGQLVLDDYWLVKDCLCGHIYDSSPVDFTSDLGTRFVLHPSVLKRPHPPRVVSWMAKALATGLDSLFIRRFEAERADYWQTLYSSVNIGPFLIFCSEDDELAPARVICDFAQRLQELGGDVELIKWKSSPHVGHYKFHASEYRNSVVELLGKAASTYAQRRLRSQNKEGHFIPESVCSLHKAAASSNESLKGLTLDPSDDFFLSSSTECNDGRDTRLQSEELFHTLNIPSINPHGVLGKILYDVCVPKNIEGWDIKPSTSFKGTQAFSHTHRHGFFSPRKCLRRSRL
ncbi:uncharacterized protein LOC122021513 [Zingiber officinale]|uniref:uncharacterized protein LOC122021513 n=1 Tax=Zingiber officinale TaxID=94328 RepID=UPI001C4C6703|nr:uncharacterized protein LOC122021513 [Zingiber officinale]